MATPYWIESVAYSLRQQFVSNHNAAAYLRHKITNFFPTGGQFHRYDPGATFIIAANKQIVATTLVIREIPLAVAYSKR